MKKIIFVLMASAALIACNRQSPVTQQSEQMTAKDSMINRLQQKDSSIMAYIRSVNSIQKNIDTLMIDAKILKIHSEKPTDTGTLISELKTIDQRILKNQRALARLEDKLRKSKAQNQDLTDLGENLSIQLNQKDSEIAVTQRMLMKTRASLRTLVNQFNDSMTVIQQQRSQIGIMKVKGNTVFYITGTKKELKKKGIITEKDGAIGLGRIPVPNGNMDTTGFTRADMTNLSEINLDGRFVELVTPHPASAYRIASGSSDKLIITDPEDFWSKSKYMIAIIK